MNSRIAPRNPNFLSVNKNIEVGFSDATIVQECKNPFSTLCFSNNFVSFEDEKLYTTGTILDIFGIFVSSKLFTKGEKHRELYSLLSSRLKLLETADIFLVVLRII
ncbi:hypothetical protein P3S68_032267 [Capsicum galapagoense]